MAEEVPEEPQEDIFYVAEKQLEDIKTKLKDSKDITKEDVDALTFPENLPDDAMMVPVDMRGVEEEFADVEEMVEKLGAKGTAEAFVKAREYFEANNKDNEDAAKEMTAKEWNEVLQNDDDDGFLDEGFLEGEEEALLEEAEEELEG